MEFAGYFYIGNRSGCLLLRTVLVEMCHKSYFGLDWRYLPQNSFFAFQTNDMQKTEIICHIDL